MKVALIYPPTCDPTAPYLSVPTLTGFLRALHKIGYDGGVAPEPLGRIPMDMPGEDAAKLAFDATTAAMNAAGVI